MFLETIHAHAHLNTWTAYQTVQSSQSFETIEEPDKYMLSDDPGVLGAGTDD
jgi:hypothetical protein